MPVTFPFSCWVGLQDSGAGFEVTGGGYARQPATLELLPDGVTGANAATIVWPQATALWGTVDIVSLFDAAGDWLGSLPAQAAVTVNQFDRVEIPPTGLQIILLTTPIIVPTGFGTFAFGIGNYGTTPEQLVSPGYSTGSPYGIGPYGAGAYERTDQGVLLIKTWDPTWLCNGEPGDWTPATVEDDAWAPVELCDGEPADWAPHGPYEIA